MPANQPAGRLNRRDFLKLSAGALGAAALTCSGAGYLASRAPALPALDPDCGDQTMNGKILITYATRAGSTAEVAQAIGQVFCEQSAQVDILPVKQVKDLEPYRAVIIGSAIRMGRWLPEAVQFVETHRERLAQLPTAYFLVSLFLKDADPEMRKTVAAYVDPVRQILEPASLGMFVGKMDLSRLSWLDRQAAKMVKAPVGDFRDWDAIQTWAGSLALSSFYASAG
jgi:menaquinone-dependent protoporphyrinogen oxidase